MLYLGDLYFKEVEVLRWIVNAWNTKKKKKKKNMENEKRDFQEWFVDIILEYNIVHKIVN